MNVYDEYVKNQGGPMGDVGDVATNGAENINPSAEEGKDSE